MAGCFLDLVVARDSISARDGFERDRRGQGDVGLPMGEDAVQSRGCPQG